MLQIGTQANAATVAKANISIKIIRWASAARIRFRIPVENFRAKKSARGDNGRASERALTSVRIRRQQDADRRDATTVVASSRVSRSFVHACPRWIRDVVDGDEKGEKCAAGARRSAMHHSRARSNWSCRGHVIIVPPRGARAHQSTQRRPMPRPPYCTSAGRAGGDWIWIIRSRCRAGGRRDACTARF